MSDWRSRRHGRTPVDVPHPNSPAGRNFNWSSLGVPHPNSPAGRNFDCVAALGILHPNSPGGRTGSTHLQHPRPASEFRLRDALDGRDDVASWASGVADTVRGLLKHESILELFGDVKLLGGLSVVADAFHEYRTHLPDPSNMLSARPSAIRGVTSAVEGRLFLTAVAPWLAIAALVIDPILHANHRKGIMDYAGEAGRAAVEQFVKQFPRDMDAL